MQDQQSPFRSVRGRREPPTRTEILQSVFPSELPQLRRRTSPQMPRSLRMRCLSRCKLLTHCPIEHLRPDRRGSSASTTITIFNHLGFLTVLSGLLQAMIVTSTNVSNAALHFLQIFFGSTMVTKRSAVEKRAQVADATEGFDTTVNPTRPPPTAVRLSFSRQGAWR